MGTVFRTPKTNDALAVVHEPSSVSVNITRPDWLNTHTLISRNARNDVPDKWQRDGIGGEASVNVAAVDNKPLSAPTDTVRLHTMQRCRLSEYIMTRGRACRLFDKLIYKSFKND